MAAELSGTAGAALPTVRRNYDKRRFVLSPKQELQISSLIELKLFDHPQDFAFPREKHECWEFVYVERGYALVIVGEHNCLLKKGEGIFQKPGEFHALRSADDNCVRTIVATFVCESPCMKFFEHGVFALTKDEQKYLHDALSVHYSEDVSNENAVSLYDEDISQGNFATSQLVRTNFVWFRWCESIFEHFQER